MSEIDARRARFRDLHASGIFLMPNPWDIGSALALQHAGFPALATTSSGFAASLGRRDQQVSRDELLDHAARMSAALDVPLSVDAERCFGVDPAGVGHFVRQLADTGAAGCSIEDYDPAHRAIDDLAVATERVGAAAEVARASGLVLTARAENHLHGIDDLDDTITRLRAYRDAGAEVVFAPLVLDLDAIGRIVKEVGLPLNVLVLPGAPTVEQLGAAGVRRISTGGALAFAAYGALLAGATELLEQGTADYGRETPRAAQLFGDSVSPP